MGKQGFAVWVAIGPSWRSLHIQMTNKMSRKQFSGLSCEQENSLIIYCRTNYTMWQFEQQQWDRQLTSKLTMEL